MSLEPEQLCSTIALQFPETYQHLPPLLANPAFVTEHFTAYRDTSQDADRSTSMELSGIAQLMSVSCHLGSGQAIRRLAAVWSPRSPGPPQEYQTSWHTHALRLLWRVMGVMGDGFDLTGHGDLWPIL